MTDGKRSEVLKYLAESWNWDWATREIADDDKPELFWAGVAQPSVEIYSAQRQLEAYAATGTRAQRVALLNRIFSELEADQWRIKGWYMDAQPLIDTMARHEPDALDGGDVKVPRSAVSQIDVALVRAGHRAEAKASTLTKVTKALLDSSSSDLQWWSWWSSIAPVAKRRGALLKVADGRIYRWSVVSDVGTGASPDEAVQLAVRISDMDHVRSAVLTLFEPHGEAVFPCIEAELKASNYATNGDAMATAATLVAARQGLALPELLQETFVERELKGYSADRTSV
ncbi:MAG: hypothetical protein AAFX99_04780, partial [Myxococcota bacterium]